ncbi:pantothenate kinase [Flavobacterium faecale]|uniref:Type III pantothenate kinase n=1 Tax=Flavobacterium faecale TaxID=1355330 RepID=A0A2S1LBU3_9FLAO|nr:type III pantothenate kinase [Flavobacterium faecale]AWG21194.1 pantothenate kinase [Flavobacterium faecale]
MILTIDVGNTRIKGAVFEVDSIVEQFAVDTNVLTDKIKLILEKYEKCYAIVIASVGKLDKKLFLDFEKRVEVHFISHDDAFPFSNLYATPKTLGIDRMVLAAGAVLQYPKANRLVIDAGTCVTYDYINADDEYLGGAISPGLLLRYKALNNYTSKLPLLELDSPKAMIGDSTSESIHSGVVNGLVYEIKGFIDEYRQIDANFIIILTGGDAVFLAKRLKNTIFANSNFLLESLNQTFQYKIKND